MKSTGRSPVSFSHQHLVITINWCQKNLRWSRGHSLERPDSLSVSLLEGQNTLGPGGGERYRSFPILVCARIKRKEKWTSYLKGRNLKYRLFRGRIWQLHFSGKLYSRGKKIPLLSLSSHGTIPGRIPTCPRNRRNWYPRGHLAAFLKFFVCWSFLWRNFFVLKTTCSRIPVRPSSACSWYGVSWKKTFLLSLNSGFPGFIGKFRQVLFFSLVGFFVFLLNFHVYFLAMYHHFLRRDYTQPHLPPVNSEDSYLHIVSDSNAFANFSCQN